MKMILYTQTGEIERDVKSVVELIDVFDQSVVKPFNINYVGNNIQFWGKDNPDKQNEHEFKLESLSFRLMEHHNTDAWGTLYGPMVHIALLDGTYKDDPQLEEITPDVITYWETRSNVVKNPIIKLQYMGLVYSFKKKITNNECDGAFLESYVRTIVDVSQNGWEIPIASTTYHLPIAMDIAHDIPHILPIVKAEFIRHTKAAKDTHVGVWLAYFHYMMHHFTDKHLFDTTEKTSVVSLMETRLAALLAKDPNAEGEEKLNPFDVKEVALLLAQFYKQNNIKADKERVVHCIETAFRKVLTQGNPMQQLAWLTEVQKCYSTYGMINEVQSIYPEIQAKGIDVKNCLQVQKHELTIPNGIVEALKTEIVCGTVDDVYSHFVSKFTLKKSAAEDFVKKQSMNPLAGMMGTLILSESGMPLSKIGTPEFDKEGNEYSFGAKLLEYESFAMRSIVETLLNKQLFTLDLIVKHIMASTLINPDRIDIIEKGVGFYLNGDYVTACHLLVPQIEHAICNLALKLGANALRMQNSGNGYMVQLMDKLFDVPEIHNVLGDDKSFYLRTLLTEQRGLNLRNMLCHGLINPMYYDASKADRIIHALLLVGELNV